MIVPCMGEADALGVTAGLRLEATVAGENFVQERREDDWDLVR